MDENFLVSLYERWLVMPVNLLMLIRHIVSIIAVLLNSHKPSLSLRFSRVVYNLFYNQPVHKYFEDQSIE